MRPTFKPYRLINDLELKTLQQEFDNKLQQWNEIHALFPLSCRLGLGPTKPPSVAPCWAKAQPTQIDTHDLSLIKHSLFGDESDCFNTLAENLFTTLLTQLLGNQSLSAIDNWFYPGTPSLTLTISCGEKTIRLYLHPQWVLNALPSSPHSKEPAIKLEDALASQRLKLDVELNSLPLTLANILRLQVGDVIKTDHPITEPAQLSQQHKRICNVDIGKSNAFKSIQITRTL